MARKRFRLPEAPGDGRAEEIRSELAELPGIGDIHVAPGEVEIVVEADREVLSDDEILAAIGRAGVEATLV
ncbi:MAG TPA: hypothetical protein VEC15_05405 [Actinomycetota bacterium]|jgi:copper chaperone CopZ|nr:hypothetical protein [Actinomycetota bacterium]